MNDFFFRAAFIGSLLFTIGACTAGNYDLPVCASVDKCGNGIDDDCDGVIDNPIICDCKILGDVQPCPQSAGIVTKSTNPRSRCEDLRRICENYQWSECKGITAITEQCGNDTDDDCDGVVDEPDCVPCVDNQVRDKYDPMANYGANSKCQPEHQVCRLGQWVTATAAVGPALNDTTCDGKDDDCDNMLDEDATWTSALPNTKTFKKGELCYDLNKKGVCRTVGTVDCASGAAVCKSVTASSQPEFRNYVSSNAFFDPANPQAIWDWNCDGKIDSVFYTGLGPMTTCTGSNVLRTKIVAVDNTVDCKTMRFPFCDNFSVIKSTVMGASIPCGGTVQVTDCETDLPIPAAPCGNNASPRSGYMYCN